MLIITTEDVNPVIKAFIDYSIDFNEVEIIKESLMDTIFSKMKKGFDEICYGRILNLNCYC